MITLKRYLHILQKEIPSLTEKDLTIPLNQAGIDSLDLVVLRVALEKYFNYHVPDTNWYEFNTLNEALIYFHNHADKAKIVNRITRQISTERNHEIRMPQMSNSALSENWLLKELGDMHWELLSKGLETKSSEFKDEAGNRLYATFVRINYLVSPLNLFLENQMITLSGVIKAFGSNTHCSSIQGKCHDNKIEANLLTNFSIREQKDNSLISKGNPVEKVNHIEQLRISPEFFDEYRLLKKNLIDELRVFDLVFKVTENVIDSIEYSINPYYDINGVGLLYFASYPIITDKCLSDYFTNYVEAIEFSEYQTVYRDIFYFSNCNKNDKIIFYLNTVEFINSNKIKLTSSLHRHSDNRAMAKIFTIKERN